MAADRMRGTIANSPVSGQNWNTQASWMAASSKSARCMNAALCLSRYMLGAFWDGGALVGPDAGVRFNWRAGRFLKSYLPSISRQDSYCYLQAQAYWILANWKLFDRTGNDHFRDVALLCSESTVNRQRPDGAWSYPNREWSDRVATTEGTWASLALLESFQRTKDPRFLSTVLSWHTFLTTQIGFEQIGNELAVNYFAGRTTARVPNNSAFVLRFLAELAAATDDSAYLRNCDGMLSFMMAAQEPAGEFPYMVPGQHAGVKLWKHFQCYQYNAFQCLDLMQYYAITRDARLPDMIRRSVGFLCGGVAPDGRAYYSCDNSHVEVIYHTAAMGAALSVAARMGFNPSDGASDRAIDHLLSDQRQDGSFPFSRGDYYLLRDLQAYPRPLAMTLYHLLLMAESR